jgi:hypothetical protein
VVVEKTLALVVLVVLVVVVVTSIILAVLELRIKVSQVAKPRQIPQAISLVVAVVEPVRSVHRAILTTVERVVTA